MSGFGPDPSDDAIETERDEWAQSQDTRGRIRTVVTGLREPTTAAAVSDQAECSTNAARKHLNDLSDLGVVRRIKRGGTTRYVRNESYFRWRKANELASTNTVDALLDELADLEAREEAYRTQFDAAVPDDVELPADGPHDEIERQLEILSEWETVREAIDRHKQALQIARNEDDRAAV
ncbi:DUF7342 family protein [Halosimplex pelagicum]|uniref:Transcriptional regulator n=1 Tax=Halosimplex pelagicum TaxID=869886 RepID=A0A7D5P5I1_9EURY|nr:transcriptional regulator [Halosimplex pelagicum]QLH81303.1 transcriptional regulator [Halosimplex pelagicum]